MRTKEDNYFGDILHQTLKMKSQLEDTSDIKLFKRAMGPAMRNGVILVLVGVLLLAADVVSLAMFPKVHGDAKKQIDEQCQGIAKNQGYCLLYVGDAAYCKVLDNESAIANTCKNL